MAAEDAGWAAQPTSVLSFAFPHCLAGTGGPSQLVGTTATSPSPAGSSGGTLRPLPSTPLPGSPGQLQSSPQASSTQTGVNHVALDAQDVMGDTTNPILTALPATDSAFGGEHCWPTALESLYTAFAFLKQGRCCVLHALCV